jgi:ubiquinone/menaquinone biosynthesis C-methylase UbiE
VSKTQLAPETVGVVIGNHTQKYTARNPAIRWLTERWVANLDRVFGQISRDQGGPPQRALEVGCGEGVIADKMHRRWGEVVALDLPDAGLRDEWRRHDGPRFLHASAHELPFADNRFDAW